MSLHGHIYNSFEDDTIFYNINESKIDKLYSYKGQIGYKEDKINIKFTYDTETNTIYVKTRYRYCMSLDDTDEYTKNVYTDSMSNDSDIFACFYFSKQNKIIPISDVFNTIFSEKEVTIILDRDYSR